jgi:large subunit ribosomal protein L31e
MQQEKEINNRINEKEKIYVINLRKNLISTPRYKKTNKAINEIKRFLVRHLKIYDKDYERIKIDPFLNEYLWKRGAKKPPLKIKVRVIEEGNLMKVQLVDLPRDLLFKEQKLEKIESKEKEKIKTKEEQEVKKEEITLEKEEKKEEMEEKKASVIESTQQFEKETAKMKKHLTKESKQPKRQRRMALQK